jgi:hypothetical protein
MSRSFIHSSIIHSEAALTNDCADSGHWFPFWSSRGIEGWSLHVQWVWSKHLVSMLGGKGMFSSIIYFTMISGRAA